jgi:hypothetical protein
MALDKIAHVGLRTTALASPCSRIGLMHHELTSFSPWGTRTGQLRATGRFPIARDYAKKRRWAIAVEVKDVGSGSKMRPWWTCSLFAVPVAILE